jgi:hypothetical protein
MSNQTLSDQYAEIGSEWADAESAASLLEDLKSAFLSQKMQDWISGGMAVNKAEASVKSSPEWQDYITKMVNARKLANKLKVQLEVLKMRGWENTNFEANNRMAARL